MAFFAEIQGENIDFFSDWLYTVLGKNIRPAGPAGLTLRERVIIMSENNNWTPNPQDMGQEAPAALEQPVYQQPQYQQPQYQQPQYQQPQYQQPQYQQPQYQQPQYQQQPEYPQPPQQPRRARASHAGGPEVDATKTAKIVSLIFGGLFVIYAIIALFSRAHRGILALHFVAADIMVLAIVMKQQTKLFNVGAKSFFFAIGVFVEAFACFCAMFSSWVDAVFGLLVTGCLVVIGLHYLLRGRAINDMIHKILTFVGMGLHVIWIIVTMITLFVNTRWYYIATTFFAILVELLVVVAMYLMILFYKPYPDQK